MQQATNDTPLSELIIKLLRHNALSSKAIRDHFSDCAMPEEISLTIHDLTKRGQIKRYANGTYRTVTASSHDQKEKTAPQSDETASIKAGSRDVLIHTGNTPANDETTSPIEPAPKKAAQTLELKSPEDMIASLRSQLPEGASVVIESDRAHLCFANRQFSLLEPGDFHALITAAKRLAGTYGE